MISPEIDNSALGVKSLPKKKSVGYAPVPDSKLYPTLISERANRYLVFLAYSAVVDKSSKRG